MIEIIYKDEDILVCIKPSGVLSAEDSSGKPSLPSLLKEQLSLTDIYPVHRLDKEVSGLMVYALTPAAAAVLSADVADHTRFLKEYLCVVEGCPKDDTGVFEDLLFKDSSKNKSYVVKRLRRGVKKAKLQYTVLYKNEDISLVRVRLFTGRTHQIRVQFASRKMPLIGDRKYGGKPSERGIALFSCKLAFSHPITKKSLCFEKNREVDDMI